MRHHKTSEELSLEQSWRPTHQEVDGAKLAPDTAQANTMSRTFIYTELRKANGNVYIYRDTHTAKTHKSLKPHVKLIRLVHTVYTHIRLIGFTKLI